MKKNIPKPEVTVFVPTYRRPTSLKKTLNSVQNQTYSNIKIHVYDDASGDDTEKIVNEIANKDSRINYYCNKKNLGPTGNYANAMLKANTPFFTFCPDDDFFLPQHIENAMNGFSQFPDVGLSINETIAMDNHGSIVFVSTFEMESGRYDSKEAIMLLLKKETALFTGTIFRKKVVETIGVLNSECGALADRDFCFKAAAQFPFVITKKSGVIFKVHADNYFASDINQYQWKQWRKYFQSSIENPFLDDETRESAKYHIGRRLTSMVKNQGWEATLNKNYDTADLCIQILKDFSKSIKYPIKLRLLRLVCKLFPPYISYLNFIKKQRYQKKIKTTKIRYQDYQKYRKYLDN